MRINVYSQELTSEVELICQQDRDGRNKHFGVRFYLKSPDCLHNTADDDDRSAITFWIPNGENFNALWLADVFLSAAGECATVKMMGAGK